MSHKSWNQRGALWKFAAFRCIEPPFHGIERHRALYAGSQSANDQICPMQVFQILKVKSDSLPAKLRLAPPSAPGKHTHSLPDRFR